MKKKIIPIGMLLISTMALHGQFESRLDDTLEIEEVKVTSTKIAVARENVAMTISAITSEEIETSDESSILPLVSENIPGVFITQRGVTGFGVASGSAGGINIRGIGGSPNTQVLILIDGTPQFMGIMGHPLPDAYVASDLQRVEVIRGPASILYGSNAMGGVINFITREPVKDGFNGSARLMYGSYNTQKYMLNGGYKKNKFHVFASINHDRTDGHRDSSDFEILNGYLKTGYQITDNIDVVADINLADFMATDPGPADAFAGETIDILRGKTSLSFENNHEKISGALKLFHNFGEHEITDGFHSTDFVTGAMFYQNIELFPGNSLTAGVDYKTFGGLAENVFAMKGEGIVFGDEAITETAGYAFVQQEFFNSLTWNGGLRWENNSVYGSEWIPHTGIAWRPFTSASIKASVSKGFRSPTIRELYLWAPANEDLLPERMINYEAGITNFFFSNRVKTELTVFHSVGDNKIAIVGQFPNVQHENTGSFTNSGIEFAGSVKIMPDLTFKSNYTFIQMDKPIISTPTHNLYTAVKYKYRNFNFNLNMQHINDLIQSTFPVETMETYTLLNARVGYHINRNINLFVSAENITDTDYSINYKYPMPGITFFGGIHLSL